MSYDTEKLKLAKNSLTACGIVLDRCTLTAGASPCTATQTGDAKCYNTRSTCNDPANYEKGTQEIIFCEPRSDLPQGVQMFPVIDKKIVKAPTTITAGKGLGARSVITVKLKDFTHHDRGIDPYINERTYKHNAENLGTFFGKLLRRNPYYEGRTLKIYYGFIGDTFSWDDFKIEEYDITDIDGPTNGYVTVKAKDILIRAYGSKAQYPTLNNGVLASGIAASAASATLSPTGIGDSEYPASGYVTIGSDVKGFTRSGDVLTFTSHGDYGTSDEAHDAGDLVQYSPAWMDENVVDVLYELLNTGAGIDSANLPLSTSWAEEKSLWLSTSLVNGILMKPEKIDKVIAELSEQFMFDIWWDAISQEVMIKALSPEPSGVTINTLTDEIELLKNSVTIKRDSAQRITEVQVWYAKLDYSEDDSLENFAAAKISTDQSRAGPDKYGSNSIKVIAARWINNGAQAQQLAGRLLARFSDTPEVVTFSVDLKDDSKFDMAGRVILNSWQMQGLSGEPENRTFQVLEIAEKEPGLSVKVKALTSSFQGRYFFVAPDSTPDYSSATEAQKQKYGFICYNTGVFLDGETAYKII